MALGSRVVYETVTAPVYVYTTIGMPFQPWPFPRNGPHVLHILAPVEVLDDLSTPLLLTVRTVPRPAWSLSPVEACDYKYRYKLYIKT